MPTVEDYRRGISIRGTSKYYCVCGVYVHKAVEEVKHCIEISKFDDMEVLNVAHISGGYLLWVRL